MEANVKFWPWFLLSIVGIHPRTNGECWRCLKYGRMIDLGDGDIMCDECWNNYVPSYKEPT
jgi:hypothetical protein